MDEIRRALDRATRGVHAEAGGLEAVRDRARRRAIRRRVVAGVLTVGILAGGFALAYVAFPLGEGAVPAAGPTPTASSATTSPVAETLDIWLIDGAPTVAVEELVSYLEVVLASEQGPYRIVTAEETEGSEVTVVFYRPGFEDEAFTLREEVFSGATVRPDEAPSELPLRIVVGEDFERREAAQIRNVETAYAFMRGRVREQPDRVEPRLSDEAAAQFERGDNGLDLYSYTAGALFDILLLERRADGTWMVHLSVRQRGEDESTEVLETLVVGDADGDGRPEILSAERNR